MLIPRRVRRRLLLPPGWVALGFLLLGCQALRPWQRQLQPMRVISLTIPKLELEPELELLDKVYEIPYKSVAEINEFRPWYNIEYDGNSKFDFLNDNATELATRQIIADTTHAGGVRVRFLPRAIYANMVKAFDILNYPNHKKYWLDIRHDPTTLYAVTTLPSHSK